MLSRMNVVLHHITQKIQRHLFFYYQLFPYLLSLYVSISHSKEISHIYTCTFLLTERRKEKRKRDTVNFDTDTDKVPYNKHIDQIYPYVFSANQSDCINEETKSALRNVNVQINSQSLIFKANL